MPTQSILILNRTFPPLMGATGRVACDLALHLRKSGYKITIITTSNTAKTDSAKLLDVVRVEAKQNPETAHDYLKISKMMYQAAKKLPPHDIVISMTDPPLMAIKGQKIAKLMRAKHIHWSMDIYPDLLPAMDKHISPWAYKFAQKSMHRALKKADAIVPISACMARYMAHLSLPRHKMHIIENWPDKYLLEDEDEPTPLLDGRKFRILYAGTIGLAHEFETVLNAAKYLQKTAPDVEFIFTARGRGQKNLDVAAQNMGLNNIRFLPPQPPKKLSSLMASGDLHLVTLKRGAAGKLFPSKFYSALAAGRPVLFVGPESCDIHKKISLSHCGATIRNGDSRILINAITNYMTNPDDWFAACKAASKLMENHNPLKQWEHLIASL